jgi:hypothetical protein
VLYLDIESNLFRTFPSEHYHIVNRTITIPLLKPYFVDEANLNASGRLLPHQSNQIV